MITLYGIANCDSVRKARRWLDGRGVEYAFHNYRKAGIDESVLRAWVAELGWEALLNRRGTTWRRLPEAVRSAVDEEGAIRLMLERPSIIRRPVLDLGHRRVAGFDAALYQTLLAPP
ncbi:MAG: ArsC family reductase [Chromatiales bacterium]